MHPLSSPFYLTFSLLLPSPMEFYGWCEIFDISTKYSSKEARPMTWSEVWRNQLWAVIIKSAVKYNSVHWPRFHYKHHGYISFFNITFRNTVSHLVWNVLHVFWSDAFLKTPIKFLQMRIYTVKSLTRFVVLSSLHFVFTNCYIFQMFFSGAR